MLNRWRVSLIWVVMFCIAISFVPHIGMAASLDTTTAQGSSLEDAVHRAAAVVVGTLTRQEARYGDASKRFIFTDHVFTIEDSLLPQSRLQLNQTVRLTFWGGTIDGETQEIADMPTLSVGERYVLFLRPEWATINGMPLTDMHDGLFRVMVDPTTKASVVFDASGLPLNLQPEGNGLQRTTTNLGEVPPAGMTLEAFVARLRQELPRIKRAAVHQLKRVASDDPRVLPIYSRPDDPTASLEMADATSTNVALSPDAALPTDAAPQAAAQPSAPAQADVQAVGSGIALSMQTAKSALAQPAQALGSNQGKALPSFSTNGYANLPIVINQFPSSWVWSPEDQLQMVSWNHYASDVFHVYATPRSTWAFRNGVFDLAGWPSSDVMKRQFGSTWEELDNPLAITFKRKSDNRIVEADIAINPAFSWTLDDEAVYDGYDLRSFRRTMTHELGHVWGLEHQFNYLSVMNYPPSLYRPFPLPFTDDAEGIRQRYPAQAVATTDLGVELFYSAGYQDWQQASFPSSVVAGTSFTVTNYQLENVGTEAVGTPTIEWYLSAARNFNGVYYYLGSTTYPALDRFAFFNPATVSRTLTVPASLPTGYYYLAAYIRGDQSATTNGFQFENSRSFSQSGVYVYP